MRWERVGGSVDTSRLLISKHLYVDVFVDEKSKSARAFTEVGLKDHHPVRACIHKPVVVNHALSDEEAHESLEALACGASEHDLSHPGRDLLGTGSTPVPAYHGAVRHHEEEVVVQTELNLLLKTKDCAHEADKHGQVEKRQNDGHGVTPSWLFTAHHAR